MSEAILLRHNRYDLFTFVECEQILKNILNCNKNVKLLNFEIKAEINTVGFLGEYFHLILKYQFENNAICEKRVFVKSMPYQCANMIIYIEKSGILRKETALYKTLLNELKKLSEKIWCAQCYYAREDLFVMENILNLGYEPVENSSSFLNDSQIKMMLKSLATIHASSIAYEVKNQIIIGEKFRDMLFEVTITEECVWYTVGLKAVQALIKAHPKYQNDSAQNFIENQLPKHFEKVYDMVNASEKYRNVFCHRDLWAGNVFFHKQHPETVGAIFADFQLCRYSPPAIDVLMLLYINLKRNDRIINFTTYCEYYYGCFAEELNEMGLKADEHLTLNEFMKSIRELELFGAVFNCLAATIIRTPNNFLIDMKLHKPDDYHRYTNVDRTKEVVELFNTHVEFSEYISECMEDVMDLILTQ